MPILFLPMLAEIASPNSSCHDLAGARRRAPTPPPSQESPNVFLPKLRGANYRSRCQLERIRLLQHPLPTSLGEHAQRLGLCAQGPRCPTPQPRATRNPETPEALALRAVHGIRGGQLTTDGGTAERQAGRQVTRQGCRIGGSEGRNSNRATDVSSRRIVNAEAGCYPTRQFKDDGT